MKNSISADPIDHARRLAAERAVDEIQNGSVIGLGTGATMRFVLEEIARRLDDHRLESIAGVPTSTGTEALARDLGIPLAPLGDLPLALAIDGADEVDPALDLLKGLGGALLREKIVASASNVLVIVADASKLVARLGTKNPIPIEVVPFGAPVVQRKLAADFRGRVQLRRGPDNEVFRTDEGNWILDCHAGPLSDPESLSIRLRRIPGIVDHGLFLGMAQKVVVGDHDGVRILTRGTFPPSL